jgi:hypothetical protein
MTGERQAIVHRMLRRLGYVFAFAWAVCIIATISYLAPKQASAENLIIGIVISIWNVVPPLVALLAVRICRTTSALVVALLGASAVTVHSGLLIYRAFWEGRSATDSIILAVVPFIASAELGLVAIAGYSVEPFGAWVKKHWKSLVSDHGSVVGGSAGTRLAFVSALKSRVEQFKSLVKKQ